MNKPPFDNGQSSFDDGDPAVMAGAGRATAVSSAGELDYRHLPGLDGDDVPTASPRTDHHQRHRHGPLFARLAAFIAVAALAVLLLRAFVIQPFAMHGDAMTPTLNGGDKILVLKSGLLQGGIHSGEIVVFHPPKALPCTVVGSHAGDLVLRVVALPGQVISSVGNTIYVDGQPLRKPSWYDHRFGPIGSTPIRSTTLAAGQYFVMADKRSDSCDSRAFGPVSKSSVVGEAIAVVGRNGHVSFGTL